MPEIPYETNLFADPGDGSAGTWEAFSQVTHYLQDLGLLQLARAGAADSPCVIVRTHSPIWTKVVSWTAMKKSGHPTVPCPEALGNNDVLLGVRISPATKVLQPSGLQHVWSISGEYTYALRYPIDPKRGLPAGASPVDRTPASGHIYPGEMFRRDLLSGTDEVRV